MLGKIDLKSDLGKRSSFRRLSRKETTDECGQIDLLTTNGLSPHTGISTMCCPLSGRLQTQGLLLLGPVSLYGFRPTDLLGELARHRSLPAVATDETLSHGHSWSGRAQHSGPRQLSSRLAHLRRLRASADRSGSRTLFARQFWHRSRPDCLLSMPRRSIYASRFFPGPFSASTRGP
jgi:hypothetical protein